MRQHVRQYSWHLRGWRGGDLIPSSTGTYQESDFDKQLSRQQKGWYNFFSEFQTFILRFKT